MPGNDIRVGQGRYEIYPELSDAGMAKFRGEAQTKFELAGVRAGESFAAGFNKVAFKSLNTAPLKASLAGLEKEFASFYKRVDPSKIMKPIKAQVAPNFAAEMNKIVSLNQKVDTAARRAAAANNRLGSSTSYAAGQAANYTGHANRAAGASNNSSRAASRASSSYRNMGGAASSTANAHIPFISTLSRVSSEMTKLASRVSYNAFQMQLFGTNITRYVTAPIAIAGAGITAFGLKASMDVEDATASLKALLPVGTNVGNVIKQIQDIAVKSPIFKFVDLLRDIQQLVGAGLDINKALAFEQAFSRIGTTLALTPEQAQSAQYAIVQMLNKGKVYSEELVQQLAEHVPGAIKMLADYFHVTTKSLLEMVKAGELSGEQVVQAFTDIGNSSKFLIGAANSSHTLRNSFNQLKESIQVSLASAFAPLRDKLEELIARYGPSVTAALSDIGNAIAQSIVKNIDSWIDAIIRLQQTFSPAVWETLAKVIGILAVAGPGLVIASKGIQAIGAAFATLAFFLSGPGLVITGITLVVAGFAELLIHSAILRNQLKDLGHDLAEVFKGPDKKNTLAKYFDSVKSAAKNLQEFLETNLVPTLRALLLGENFDTQVSKRASDAVNYPLKNKNLGNSTQRSQVPQGLPGQVERQQTPYALVPKQGSDQPPNKSLIDKVKELHDWIVKVVDAADKFIKKIREIGGHFQPAITIINNYKEAIKSLSAGFKELGINVDGSKIALIGILIMFGPITVAITVLTGALWALSYVARYSAWVFEHVAAPAFGFLKDVMLHDVIPAVGLFAAALLNLPGAWRRFWDGFGYPIYSFFSGLLIDALRVGAQGAVNVANGIVVAFHNGWITLWNTALNPIRVAFVSILPDSARQLWSWIAYYWNATYRVIWGAWITIYNTVVRPLYDAFTRTLPAGAQALRDFINATFGAITSRLAQAWSDINSRFVAPLYRAMTQTLPSAFKYLSDSAAAWMSNMGNVIVRSLNWVLGKVDAFLGKFNEVKGALKLPLPDLHVGGLSSGGLSNAAAQGLDINPNKRASGGPTFLRPGMIHAPGNGTSDNLVAVSNNEYVVNAKKTKQFLPLLDYINFGKRHAAGGLTGDGIPRYGLGGFLSDTLGVAAHAVENLTQGALDYIINPGHIISDLFEKMVNSGHPGNYAGDMGVGVFRKWTEAFMKWFTDNVSLKFSQGFQGGLGTESGQSWDVIGQIAQAVQADAHVSSGYRPGEMLANGPSWHASGQAADLVSGDMDGLAQFFYDKLSSAILEEIHANGGRHWGIKNAVKPYEMGEPLWSQHNDHVHIAMHRDAALAALSWVRSGAHGAFAGVGGPGGSPSGGAQEYAAALLRQYGWGADQFGALKTLWDHESGWNPNAVNPSSGAYGIPQALGQGHPFNLGDWAAQIRWGLSYIQGRYGSPAAAWAFWQGHNWYDNGGLVPPGLTAVMNGTGRPEHMVTEPQASYLMNAVSNPPTVNVFIGNERLDERTDYRIELAFDDLARELNAA